MRLLSELEIKPIVLGPQEAEEAAGIMGARLPEMPPSAPGLLSAERVAPANQVRLHHLAWLDGEIVGFLRTHRDPDSSKLDHWYVDAYMDPNRFSRRDYGQMLHHAIELVRHQGGRLVFADTFDHFGDERAEMESMGFEVAQTQLWTQLDLARVDNEAFRGVLERARESGVRIARLEELDGEGYDWRQAFYDMNDEIMRDVPLPMPYTSIPYDQYLREIEDPIYFPRESQWVALRGHEMLGVTMLFRRIANPVRAQTGLTGVVRRARRTGLATALKATAMSWAREEGIRWITADNERENPMYRLNLQLGFEDLFTQLWYRLSVD